MEERRHRECFRKREYAEVRYREREREREGEREGGRERERERMLKEECV